MVYWFLFVCLWCFFLFCFVFVMCIFVQQQLITSPRAKMSGSVSQHDREKEWRKPVRGEKKFKTEEPVIAVLQMLLVFIREIRQ